VCTHRACLRTALLNEISTGPHPKCSSGCCRCWHPVGRSGRAFGTPGAPSSSGRCDPERRSGVLGRRSQFAVRPLGWSDLNRLLEQAGAPVPCQISIPKPAVGDAWSCPCGRCSGTLASEQEGAYCESIRPPARMRRRGPIGGTPSDVATFPPMRSVNLASDASLFGGMLVLRLRIRRTPSLGW